MSSITSQHGAGRSRLAAGALVLIQALGMSQFASAQDAPATPNIANPGIRWEKSFPPVAAGKWTGHRLSDGQPDIQGDWSNTIGNHNNLTDPLHLLSRHWQRGDVSVDSAAVAPQARRAGLTFHGSNASSASAVVAFGNSSNR